MGRKKEKTSRIRGKTFQEEGRRKEERLESTSESEEMGSGGLVKMVAKKRESETVTREISGNREEVSKRLEREKNQIKG